MTGGVAWATGDAANRKARAAFHKIGIGTADLAHMGFDLLFIHPPVARGDHQHSRVVALAAGR